MEMIYVYCISSLILLVKLTNKNLLYATKDNKNELSEIIRSNTRNVPILLSQHKTMEVYHFHWNMRLVRLQAIIIHNVIIQ